MHHLLSILSISTKEPSPLSHSTLSPLVTFLFHPVIFCDISSSPWYPPQLLDTHLLISFSSHIVSTCSSYFQMFFPILSSTLNSHPHLSLISEFLTLPILYMPHTFLKYIISNTSIFSTPAHLMPMFQSHISLFVSQSFYITPVLLLWISCSLSITLPLTPIPFFPSRVPGN